MPRKLHVVKFIDSCEECTYLHRTNAGEGENSKHYCNHPNVVNGTEVEDISVIPYWCLLEKKNETMGDLLKRYQKM